MKEGVPEKNIFFNWKPYFSEARIAPSPKAQSWLPNPSPDSLIPIPSPKEFKF